MDDRRLVAELVDAAERPHVRLDEAERRFVRRLKGRERLDGAERERAERIFRDRVDW